jgi:hypothetical protein
MKMVEGGGGVSWMSFWKLVYYMTVQHLLLSRDPHIKHTQFQSLTYSYVLLSPVFVVINVLP